MHSDWTHGRVGRPETSRGDSGSAIRFPRAGISRYDGYGGSEEARLLVEIGTVAAEYQDRVMRNLPCRRIQVDELWTFNYCKARNVTPEIRRRVPGAGDMWLWVSMCADTKLVPCVLLGGRDGGSAYEFIHDLASRLKNRIQLTSDGHRPYLEAVESAFGGDIDYAMLVNSTVQIPQPRESAVTALRFASGPSRSP